MPPAESEVNPASRAGERKNNSPFALCHGKWKDRTEFDQLAGALSECLPEAKQVINLCQDRYLFAAGFAAAIRRGQTVLLPPDRSSWMLDKIATAYPDVYCLLDGVGQELAMKQFVLDLSQLRAGRHQRPDTDVIPSDRVVAIPFTSGSTGQPEPHPKTWGHFQESARLIAHAIGLKSGTSIVATVPAQHMYGLELSVLLPFFCEAVMETGRPFFPLDVRDRLASVPEPRILVTTPVHLRALLESDMSLPPITSIISATAPLSSDLATAVEARFASPLIEIYGCTEVGSIASRRPALDAVWTCFEGVTFENRDDQCLASAWYFPDSITLADAIVVRKDGRFTLEGRTNDLVNIAGKRASLSALNHMLTSIEGVADGVFFLPDGELGRTARFSALVVAPEVETDRILERLRQQLDPAFLPRSLYRVKALPRSETGKLPNAALKQLIKEISQK